MPIRTGGGLQIQTTPDQHQRPTVQQGQHRARTTHDNDQQGPSATRPTEDHQFMNTEVCVTL
ncbi:MAG: hypothetical protein QOA17_11115 [Nitrososphaeraceae archaeon]|nr:hypothetical protein [Nitrososphaeraceae archaeon]